MLNAQSYQPQHLPRELRKEAVPRVLTWQGRLANGKRERAKTSSGHRGGFEVWGANHNGGHTPLKRTYNPFPHTSILWPSSSQSPQSEEKLGPGATVSLQAHWLWGPAISDKRQVHKQILKLWAWHGGIQHSSQAITLIWSRSCKSQYQGPGTIRHTPSPCTHHSLDCTSLLSPDTTVTCPQPAPPHHPAL